MIYLAGLSLTTASTAALVRNDVFPDSIRGFRRIDALNQFLEPRIASQGVEPSVDLNTAKDAGVEGRAIFFALFQQSQGFVFIAKGQMDHCERISRDVTFPRCSR